MSDDNNESLINHIEELRKTLLKCIIAFSIVLPFAFFFAPKILNLIINVIVGETNLTLNYFSPTEVFLIQIKTAFVVDLVLTFPYIAKQMWNFILPALYDNEKSFIKSIALISTFLFVCGILFSLFFILPLIMKFGLSFSTNLIKPVISISTVVNMALWLSLVFGLMFQLPLLAYSLVKSGFISYKTVANLRPYIIVGILIFAGILTPPDIVSQLMLAVPTYLLFELGLLFANYKKVS